MMQRHIPSRTGGYLTEEEERVMRETMNRDSSHDEVYEGIPNPITIFRVELDHAQMAELSAVRAQDSRHPNLNFIIQRWVEERLAAEVAALDVAQPERGVRSA